MRTIVKLEFVSALELICQFNNGTTKFINLKDIAQSEVFHFLNSQEHIYQVKNKKYFIEWEKHEADLSADTLWHLGSVIENRNAI